MNYINGSKDCKDITCTKEGGIVMKPLKMVIWLHTVDEDSGPRHGVLFVLDTY
jgi:hypothetical protein